jgi:D-alanine-D-alanine ligase-like ATP-grasp enzyme
MRYLVLNGEVIAVHESKYGVSVEADRDLERISYPQADWSDELTRLSLHVADLLGLRFAAVDYLIDANGKHHVLEVNSSPGLKWFHAPTSGPPVDVAAFFLEALLADLSPDKR